MKNEELLVVAGKIKEQKKRIQMKKGSCNQGCFRGSSRGLKSSEEFCNRRRKSCNANGRILRCYACGSLRHLLAACPDSLEDMEGEVNTKEVFPMGYSRKRVNKLMVDTNNSADFDNSTAAKSIEVKRSTKLVVMKVTNMREKGLATNCPRNTCMIKVLSIDLKLKK